MQKTGVDTFWKKIILFRKMDKRRPPRETQKQEKTTKNTAGDPLGNHLKKTQKSKKKDTNPACKSQPPVAWRAPSPQTPLPFVARLLPAPSITLKACFPESAAVLAPPASVLGRLR